eukprot:TRINITY_DN10422_c0_g2_i1.p1 TRINITY_DN10422_c0_g2~~TRINITY_DN10422_c0_g2_i1.p1  ORF type:complete len:627 (+),score=60.93 TRINITY_DN10422_c0_g2_i1:261-1883(+)
MLALAADPLMAIVDTAFVGHLGPEPLGALGVNTALFAFTFLVFNFLSTATTPLIATSLAENNKRRSGVLCAQGITAASVFGVILVAILLLNADTFLHWMGIAPEQDQLLYDYAKDFLLTRAWAAPAVLLITVAQGIFRGGKDTRTPLAVTIGANVVNLSLDFVLIAGMGMGLRGAGIATNTAEWVAAIVFMGILYRRRKEFGIRQQSFTKVRLQEYIPFLSAGAAVLMRTAVLLGTKTLATGTIARMGTLQVASYQVLYQVWITSSLLIDSLAVAGQALVAIELGRGSIAEAKQVSNRLLQLGFALGLILCLFFGTLGSHGVSALFTDNPSVVKYVDEVFVIPVGILPINAIAFVFDGILLGASDFRYLAQAMAAVTACTVVVLEYVEQAGWGQEGVWWSLALLMVLRAGSLGARYLSDDGPFGTKRILPKNDNSTDSESQDSDIDQVCKQSPNNDEVEQNKLVNDYYYKSKEFYQNGKEDMAGSYGYDQQSYNRLRNGNACVKQANGGHIVNGAQEQSGEDCVSQSSCLNKEQSISSIR